MNEQEILDRLQRIEEKCDRILKYFAEVAEDEGVRPALSFERIHEEARRRRAR